MKYPLILANRQVSLRGNSAFPIPDTPLETSLVDSLNNRFRISIFPSQSIRQSGRLGIVLWGYVLECLAPVPARARWMAGPSCAERWFHAFLSVWECAHSIGDWFCQLLSTPTVSENILKAIKTLAFIIIFWYFALWDLIFYSLIWIYNYKIKYPKPLT